MAVPRSVQDFLELLPCPEYTLPERAAAPLNLAAAIPHGINATDLGPKTYVAFGRLQESTTGDGDSVTKLHDDMSDAVNVLVHVQPLKGEERLAADVRCGQQEAVRPG